MQRVLPMGLIADNTADVGLLRKLLDSGYYAPAAVAEIAKVPLPVVLAVQAGQYVQARRPAYTRCPTCGYAVSLPCVACAAAQAKPTACLAASQRAYVAWVRAHRLPLDLFRYAGGTLHLTQYPPHKWRVWCLPGWQWNPAYDDWFLDALADYNDFGPPPASVAKVVAAL